MQCINSWAFCYFLVHRSDQLDLICLPLLLRAASEWLSSNLSSSLPASPNRERLSTHIRIFGFVLADLRQVFKQCAMQMRPNKSADETRLLALLESASASVSPLELKTRLLHAHIERVQTEEISQIIEYFDSFTRVLGSLSASGVDTPTTALLELLASRFNEQSRDFTQILETIH